MKAGPGLPPRPLLVLLGVVVLVHWIALEGAPSTTLAWTRAQRSSDALTVRAITPTPPALPPAVAAPARKAPSSTRNAGPGSSPPASRSVEPGSSPAPTRSAAPASSPIASPPVALAGSARWHYAAAALHRGALLAGHAELDWQHDGRTYEATLRIEIAPLPTREQRSAGQLDAQGLAPRRFSERSRTEEAAHFDRDAGRIVFSGQQPAAPLRAGAQDRLSVLLQLGALLAARPHGWPEGTELILQTATAREAGDWRFVVEGPQTLSLGDVPTAALKLTRAPRHEWDARLELWFVPGAGSCGPVRLRLTPANGDWLELQWSGTDKR